MSNTTPRITRFAGEAAATSEACILANPNLRPCASNPRTLAALHIAGSMTTALAALERAPLRVVVGGGGWRKI